MIARATRIELALFSLALLILSAAPTSLYVKLFAYSPPFPDFVIYLPVLALMTINIVLRLREAIFGALAAWAWTGIALLGLGSYLWSVSPLDTFREGLILAVSVPYLVMIAGIADWRDLLVRAYNVGLGLLILSLLLYGLAPNLGRMTDVYEGALTGPWYEKNATGQFLTWMGLISLAVAVTRPTRMLLCMLSYLMCAVMVVLTESATSLVALALGTMVFVWVLLIRRTPMFSIPTAILTVLVVGPMVALGAGFAAQGGEAALSALGRSGTLTGRVPIWDALRDFALNERPRLGHGYGAYWSDAYTHTRREFVFDQLGFEARHAHNAFLEMRLGLGWAGAVLFVAAAVQGLIACLARLRSSHGIYFALPFASALFLVALVESSPASTANWGGALFVLALAKLTLPPTRLDRQSALVTTLNRLSRTGRPLPA